MNSNLVTRGKAQNGACVDIALWDESLASRLLTSGCQIGMLWIIQGMLHGQSLTTAWWTSGLATKVVLVVKRSKGLVATLVDIWWPLALVVWTKSHNRIFTHVVSSSFACVTCFRQGVPFLSCSWSYLHCFTVSGTPLLSLVAQSCGALLPL